MDTTIALPSRGTSRDPRRDEIVHQLSELFVSEGFARFTIADLARLLRCSRSTLYLAGSTKDQIIATALRHFARGVADRVERDVGAARTPVERIAAYFGALADAFGYTSAAFRRDFASSVPAREVYRQNSEQARLKISALIEDGVAAGHFRPIDARFASAAVGAMLDAVLDGEITSAVGLDLSASYHAIGDLVLHGLLLN